MEKVHIAQLEAMQVAATNGILAGGGIYVSDVIYVRGFSNITGFAFSDVDSAADGLVIQQAADATDFSTTTPFALTAGSQSTITITGGDLIGNAFSVEVVAPFARIVYTNGAGAQSTFRLWAMARATSW